MATKGGMTVSQAGKKGGQSTSERYGHEFYQEIGKKGGKIGGEVVREKYGHGFYESIGRKGGQRVRELIKKGKR